MNPDPYLFAPLSPEPELMTREQLVDELKIRRVQLNHMFNQMIALQSTCPRRYRLPDGTEMVWHCPNELIPVTDLATNKPINEIS